MVIASPAVTHRLPEEHSRPDQFWPERFCTGHEGKLERQALIGFGGGLHRCLGVHFAYLEMKVILARLLRRYDFELLGTDPRPVPGMHTKWPDSPCRVRYRKRVPGSTSKLSMSSSSATTASNSAGNRSARAGGPRSTGPV
jgi:sterol 14-demethylase